MTAGFRWDTAFYNRTGFTWLGDMARSFLSQRLQQGDRQTGIPVYVEQICRDEIQNGNERFSLIALRMNFTRQASSESIPV
jgi:hypothetical protein